MPAYLEDYACLALGLVALYEATFDERWIDESVQLIEIVQQHFADPDAPGFFFAAADQPTLITRLKDMYDNATPCGNAVLATVLVRLGRICGRQDYLELAQALIEAAGSVIESSAMAAGQWLVALDSLLGPSAEIVLLGDRDDASAVFASLRSKYRPHTVALFRDPSQTDRYSAHLEPMFAGRTPQDDQITAYVCHGSTCEPALSGAEAIIERIV